MEPYERIRKANRNEGLGIRALADRFHVHRRTVRPSTPPAGTPFSPCALSDKGRAGAGSGVSRGVI